MPDADHPLLATRSSPGLAAATASSDTSWTDRIPSSERGSIRVWTWSPEEAHRLDAMTKQYVTSRHLPDAERTVEVDIRLSNERAIRAAIASVSPAFAPCRHDPSQLRAVAAWADALLDERDVPTPHRHGYVLRDMRSRTARRRVATHVVLKYEYGEWWLARVDRCVGWDPWPMRLLRSPDDVERLLATNRSVTALGRDLPSYLQHVARDVGGTCDAGGRRWRIPVAGLVEME